MTYSAKPPPSAPTRLALFRIALALKTEVDASDHALHQSRPISASGQPVSANSSRIIAISGAALFDLVVGQWARLKLTLSPP